MDYADDLILQQLPERPRTTGACPSADMDWSCTPVEAYVRDVVETQESLNDSGLLLDIMEALLAEGVRPPVSLADVKRALKRIPADVQKRVRKTYAFGGFMGPVLKALNGPDYKLVPEDVLASAALRHRLMSTTDVGWGMSEPPEYATCWRLLVSAGLDGDLLPEYKMLQSAVRARLCNSWADACAQFGWDEIQPPRDRPRRKP